MEIQNSSVAHELIDAELLNENVLEENQQLRWMVFKVKQRAASNYYKQIGSEQEADVPFYTYNWPYDFFSMVELASIDAEVTFTPTKKNLRIKKKKRNAAEDQLKERLKERKKRPIDVNIGEED